MSSHRKCRVMQPRISGGRSRKPEPVFSRVVSLECAFPMMYQVVLLGALTTDSEGGTCSPVQCSNDCSFAGPAKFSTAVTAPLTLSPGRRIRHRDSSSSRTRTRILPSHPSLEALSPQNARTSKENCFVQVQVLTHGFSSQTTGSLSEDRLCVQISSPPSY